MKKVLSLTGVKKAELRYDDDLTSNDFLRIMMWLHEKISKMNWEIIEEGIREKGEKKCH